MGGRMPQLGIGFENYQATAFESTRRPTAVLPSLARCAMSGSFSEQKSRLGHRVKGAYRRHRMSCVVCLQGAAVAARPGSAHANTTAVSLLHTDLSAPQGHQGRSTLFHACTLTAPSEGAPSLHNPGRPGAAGANGHALNRGQGRNANGERRESHAEIQCVLPEEVPYDSDVDSWATSSQLQEHSVVHTLARKIHNLQRA